MKRPDPAKLEALIADRSGFLRLLTAAPRSKRELTELLDCSRSTIDRVLRSLADAYLVEYRDGEWHATAAGACAYRKHDEYASFLSYLADAAPILAALPTETSIDDAFLEDQRRILRRRTSRMQFLTQCFSQSVRPPSFEDSRLRPLSAQRWTSTTLPLQVMDTNWN